jgi:hypothetical protein
MWDAAAAHFRMPDCYQYLVRVMPRHGANAPE